MACPDLGDKPPSSPGPPRWQPADGSRALSTAWSIPLQTQASAAPQRGCEEGRRFRRRRSSQGSSHCSRAPRRSPGCAPRRAPCAQARRPAGGPVRRPLSRGGEETQGDQEEEQERVKERRRSGRRGRRRAEPARPCPAQPAGGRDQPGGPTLAFRFTYAQGAAQRPGCAGACPGRSRCCSRLAFGPWSCEPRGRHVAAAAEPARIFNS